MINLEYLQLIYISFFRGVVAVTMDLLKLDISQCGDDYWVANAFKDTNKCDQKTSYVSIIIFLNCCYFIDIQCRA